MSPLADAFDGRLLGIQTVSQDGATVVILRGEADLASVEQLRKALDRVAVDGGGRVRVQVAELEFADTAALGQLTLFANRARVAGCSVTTSGAKPVVRKLAHLLRVDDELGLS